MSTTKKLKNLLDKLIWGGITSQKNCGKKKIKQNQTLKKMKQNLLTPEQEKKLMGKLRSPIHFNYVSHLLKISAEEAEYILIELEKQGIVNEYNPQIAKGYYTLVNKKENDS